MNYHHGIRRNYYPHCNNTGDEFLQSLLASASSITELELQKNFPPEIKTCIVNVPKRPSKNLPITWVFEFCVDAYKGLLQRGAVFNHIGTCLKNDISISPRHVTTTNPVVYSVDDEKIGSVSNGFDR